MSYLIASIPSYRRPSHSFRAAVAADVRGVGSPPGLASATDPRMSLDGTMAVFEGETVPPGWTLLETLADAAAARARLAGDPAWNDGGER